MPHPWAFAGRVFGGEAPRCRWQALPSLRRRRGTVAASEKRSTYGVKLVRGPFLSLAPHGSHCETPDELKALVARLREDDPEIRLAADLFSGAGGLSLGLRDAGFAVVVAVDHYREAMETHRHHFPGLTVDWDLSEASNV